jgi:hypothetical protein
MCIPVLLSLRIHTTSNSLFSLTPWDFLGSMLSYFQTLLPSCSPILIYSSPDSVKTILYELFSLYIASSVIFQFCFYFPVFLPCFVSLRCFFFPIVWGCSSCVIYCVFRLRFTIRGCVGMYVFHVLPRSPLSYYIGFPSLSLSWLLHKHVEGSLFNCTLLTLLVILPYITVFVW